MKIVLLAFYLQQFYARRRRKTNGFFSFALSFFHCVQLLLIRAMSIVIYIIHCPIYVSSLGFHSLFAPELNHRIRLITNNFREQTQIPIRIHPKRAKNENWMGFFGTSTLRIGVVLIQCVSAERFLWLFRKFISEKGCACVWVCCVYMEIS